MLLPDKTTWRGASESVPTHAHLQHLLCTEGWRSDVAASPALPLESELAADPSGPSEGPLHLQFIMRYICGPGFW